MYLHYSTACVNAMFTWFKNNTFALTKLLKRNEVAVDWKHLNITNTLQKYNILINLIMFIYRHKFMSIFCSYLSHHLNADFCWFRYRLLCLVILVRVIIRLLKRCQLKIGSNIRSSVLHLVASECHAKRYLFNFNENIQQVIHHLFINFRQLNFLCNLFPISYLHFIAFISFPEKFYFFIPNVMVRKADMHDSYIYFILQKLWINSSIHFFHFI